MQHKNEVSLSHFYTCCAHSPYTWISSTHPAFCPDHHNKTLRLLHHCKYICCFIFTLLAFFPFKHEKVFELRSWPCSSFIRYVSRGARNNSSRKCRCSKCTKGEQPNQTTRKAVQVFIFGSFSFGKAGSAV